MKVEQNLRVMSIRSENPRGFGGFIFTAKPIDSQGRVQDSAGYFVIKASGAALGGSRVEPGQWWTVSGESSTRLQEVNGYQVAETQINVSTADLLRPSGEQIVAFIADSPAFEGIGQIKAQRLWEAFGDDLYDHLDAGNVTELVTVLTPYSAAQIVAAWAQLRDSRTLQWLQTQGFDLALSYKVLQFFGPNTPQKLEEDPYRLLSFCANWRQTDALARTHFGIDMDDPRRLQGAIEEACYRVFAAGHTAVLPSKLMGVLQGILGSQTHTFRWRDLIPTALSQGLSNGSFLVGENGVQPLGALVMEREVAQAVADRLNDAEPPILPTSDINELLFAYEKVEGIELNPLQRDAIHLAAAKSLVLITGGAGVGKTTVLKALYEVYDRAGIAVTQLALAGSAAKRMQEATGRPASTIASLLHKDKEGGFDRRNVVVVDEASMVDIITMSRLCDLLGPGSRLVLVGDPEQLMPVGPGLVLHSLLKVPQVPAARLTVVKRYGSAIAMAAASIRKGSWPALGSDSEAPISFVRCSARGSELEDASIDKTVLNLYMQDPANTKILCARHSGLDGAKVLNALCQSVLSYKSMPIQIWDRHHDAFVSVGLRLGDPVLCTRNLWDHGLLNGSLGAIVGVENEPRMLQNESSKETEFALAWVDWDDGVRRPIVEDMLDDLELGYAITVHKAQGSKWPRVIVPITGHRLLDRTLIYTAVTRAQQQVLLVGDVIAAKKAVEEPPRAQMRDVALDLTLSRQLQKLG